MMDNHSSWKDSSRQGTLTIRGIQSGFGQKDTNEVITKGTYVKKDGKRYIFYKEYAEDGSYQNARLTIEDKDVYLKKTGMGTSILHFHKGRMEPCSYQSPVGPMELVSRTRSIRLREGDHRLLLRMDYSLYMHGEIMSDYILELLWEEK